MKFPEFNKEVNPNNSACYIANINGIPTTPKTFAEISALANTEPNMTVGWLIPKGYVVIEVDNIEILPKIKKRKEELMVVRDGNTLQIYCKSSTITNSELNLLACGLDAKVFAHSKSGNAVMLPYKKSSINSSAKLKGVEVVYSNKIGEIPVWLQPLYKKSLKVNKGISLPITSNASTALTQLFRELKVLDVSVQREVLEFVNDNFVTSPLTEDEINNIVTVNSDSFIEEFFEGRDFKHNKLGDYIIDRCHVKKDAISKELFYYDEYKNIYSKDPEYLTGYITRICPTLKSFQIEETVKYIQRYLYNEKVVFNENPLSVVFKNGILDISTMKLEPMTPDNLESIQINCNYNPDAYSETVDEFFATATNGNKATEQLLYEVIGYSMLKTNELQKAFILVGAGRNGKSTYLDLIKNVLGKQNTTTVSFKDLASTFRASMLDGKLASLAGDISSQPITESDLIKSISAGEDITIEEKYKAAQSKSLFSTLLFACNKLPRTPDTSEGFYRRFTIIPFNADLGSVKRVEGMLFKNKLLSQESLDYVAWKAIDAIYKVLSTTQEFTEPECVLEMIQQYKVDNSTVLSWFKDMYDNNKEKVAKQKIGPLYVSYRQWCDQAGRMCAAQNTFAASLKVDLGIEIK